MKLIFCPICNDIVKLVVSKTRKCECGTITGKYIDGLNAEISNLAIPIGINNSSLVKALRNQPKEGMGERFEAFVIPKKVSTIKRK